MSETNELKFSEIQSALRVPFTADLTSWLPKSVNKEKKQALALAYIEPRNYEDRLNVLCPDDWEVFFRPWGDNQIICELTICGLIRSSTGEAEANDANTATSAEAQAFKRACSKFGLGRYLYSMPRQFAAVEIGEKGKCRGFTREAKKLLYETAQRVYDGLTGSKSAAPSPVPAPAAPRPQATPAPAKPAAPAEREPGDDLDAELDDENPFKEDFENDGSPAPEQPAAPALPEGVVEDVVQFVNTTKKDGTFYTTKKGKAYHFCKTEFGRGFSDFSAHLKPGDEVLLVESGDFWNVYEPAKNGNSK